jgi:Haem-dependent oxidative N-demethylase, alpha subunit-like
MTTAAPYLPFSDGKPFALRMGLQPLPPEPWIEIGEDHAAQLKAKRDLFDTRHSDVLQALPEAKSASEEALQLLLAHLRQYHSDRFAFADGKLRNIATGEMWDPAHSPLHPLEQAGRLVQEDFCILQADDKPSDDRPSDDKIGGGTYRLTAGAVCFPSNWRLSDKIGRALAEVHGPVPGYAEKLGAPVDRVFKNLTADTIMARANWLIHATPDLFQAGHKLDAATAAAITPTNAGEKLWLRIERQTLRRLPQSGAVLFTIRTHITRLRDAIRDPKSAQDLALAVRTMPDDVARYRSMSAFRPALLEWLDARATRQE